jgi:D-alanine transaminase
MQSLGYYNGVIGPLEEMKVPMTDRGCFFGDGIYEAALGHNHVIYTLGEHLDRFYINLGIVAIHPTLTKEELAQILTDCLRRVSGVTHIVYWQMTRGTAPRQHAFPRGVEPNLWVTVVPRGPVDLSRRVKLITVEDTRYFHCNVKTLNLLVNCLAAEKAEQAGCYEAVFHRGDVVTECSHSNVHIFRDGQLWTHPADNLILPGITRRHLIAHCRKFDIPVREEAFTLAQLMDADEVIITASTSLFAPATHIDGVEVGGRAPDLIKKFQDSFTAEFLAATKGD